MVSRTSDLDAQGADNFARSGGGAKDCEGGQKAMPEPGFGFRTPSTQVRRLTHLSATAFRPITGLDWIRLDWN
jgi:hypothetical protein